MNCERCKTLLPPDARFCRVCGLPVAAAADNRVSNTPPFNPPARNGSPTIPAPWSEPQTTVPSPAPQWGSSTETTPPSGPQWGQATQAVPSPAPQWTQPTQAAAQSYQSPLVIPSPAPTRSSTERQVTSPPARPRRRFGCLPKILITLVILALLVTGGWFIGLRPYLHTVAQNQIDQELANSINQIIPIPPPINSIPVTETMINNLIVLNHSPSDPVQNAHITITPGNLQLDFQVYSFSCLVDGKLTVSNGNLVVTNVVIQGIIGLIMSPDELTSILNNQLADVQSHIHRSISSVTLKDHEIDIMLGSIII
ncbi:MAG TPA: hypothetical protein VKV20_01055 [Ktedonobacteraceae bacterium]|nr:hypothetical protein [Ktedonobacteraceae bacterium]